MQNTKPSFSTPAQFEVPLRAGAHMVQSATVGVLLAVKTLMLPVLADLAEEAPRLFDQERLDLIVATHTVTANDIADLCVLLERLDVVVDFVATLSGLPRDQVAKLQFDEFGYLFAVVVQVNADFFVQALPVLKAAWQRVRESGVTAGLQKTSGTSSSQQPSTA